MLIDSVAAVRISSAVWVGNVGDAAALEYLMVILVLFRANYKLKTLRREAKRLHYT